MTQMSLFRIVIAAKEAAISPTNMRCHYSFWRLKSLRYGLPFISSLNNQYILLVVYYVSKWVWATGLPINGAKVVAKFSRKNRFATPQVIISDDGTHFCNRLFASLLAKYGDKHMLATAYYPKTIAHVDVSNREVKRILKTIVIPSRKDGLNYWMMLCGLIGQHSKVLLACLFIGWYLVKLAIFPSSLITRHIQAVEF